MNLVDFNLNSFGRPCLTINGLQRNLRLLLVLYNCCSVLWNILSRLCFKWTDLRLHQAFFLSFLSKNFWFVSRLILWMGPLIICCLHPRLIFNNFRNNSTFILLWLLHRGSNNQVSNQWHFFHLIFLLRSSRLLYKGDRFLFLLFFD